MSEKSVKNRFYSYFIPKLALNSDSAKRRYMTFLVSIIVSPVICLFLAAWMYYLESGWSGHSLFLLISVIIFPFYMLLLKITKRLLLAAFASFLHVAVLIFVFLFTYGVAFSPSVPWLVVLPLVAIYYFEGRLLIFNLALLFVAEIGVLIFSSMSTIELPMSMQSMAILLSMSTICAMVFIVTLTYSTIFQYSASEKHLRFLNSIDELTGIGNRRYFMAAAKEVVAHDYLKGNPIAVLMIDIDDFKTINDQYGHDVGDIAITTIANLSKNALREQDILARIGGEEFAVVLSNTNLSTAKKISERLRASIERHTLSVSKTVTIKLTVSIGLASRKTLQDKDLQGVLKAADIALYDAKTNGKNRVSININ